MKSTGDSESPCGVPTVELNGADRATSALTVIFVSDSRSRMIRTLSVSRNECKIPMNFFRRIVSNARDKASIVPIPVAVSSLLNLSKWRDLARISNF